MKTFAGFGEAKIYAERTVRELARGDQSAALAPQGGHRRLGHPRPSRRQAGLPFPGRIREGLPANRRHGAAQKPGRVTAQLLEGDRREPQKRSGHSAETGPPAGQGASGAKGGQGRGQTDPKRRQLLAKPLPGAGISQPKPRSSPARAVCAPTAASFGAAATGTDRDAWQIHQRQIQVVPLAKQKAARTGLLLKYPRT